MEYGRVYSATWENPVFRRISDDAKVVVLYLYSTQHGSIAGVFRLPDGYIAEDLGWPTERVKEAFGEVLRNGFANRCETTKWVWIADHLKRNPLDNPNQRKAAAKVVARVPDDCSWKRQFFKEFGASLGLDPYPEMNPSRTVSETVPATDRESVSVSVPVAIPVAPSDADASGSAAAPPDPADVIFGLGVPLLTSAGVKEGNARSMLGLQRKQHGDDAVIAALQRCADEKPLQPVSWLQAVLKASAPAGRRGSHDLSRPVDYTLDPRTI